jgi:hypothetical protein
MNRMQVMSAFEPGRGAVTFLYADLLSRAKLFAMACLWHLSAR